jgi:hypothetical protein
LGWVFLSFNSGCKITLLKWIGQINQIFLEYLNKKEEKLFALHPIFSIFAMVNDEHSYHIP